MPVCVSAKLVRTGALPFCDLHVSGRVSLDPRDAWIGLPRCIMPASKEG